MNCKFKFHLQAALHRGAGRAGGAPLDWLGAAELGGHCRAGGSAGLGGPTGGPDEALPNLVGAAGPGAPPASGMRFTVLRIPRVRARKPSSLTLRAGVREPRRPAGSFFRIFRSAVRARKPSSLALRAGVREPCRSASSFFRIFRSAVRARKPSSLTLRAGGREPRRSAGSFFRIFRSAVRARKPSSLALRAGVREPCRSASSFFRIFRSAVRARKPSSLALRAGGREPGCVQMKRDARKAPPASVHLFPLLFFQKERIDDELTFSPRRRQF